MSITKTVPPKLSLAKLHSALRQLVPRTRNAHRSKRTKFGEAEQSNILYPIPIYAVRLTGVLAGESLEKVVRRVAWIYFVSTAGRRAAAVEISVIGRRHKNARMIEGPFASTVLNAMKKLSSDRRARGRLFQLRSVRVDSLHAFLLWLKASDRTEFWIPITPIGATVARGEWLSRKEFSAVLQIEAKRLEASQHRATQLMKRG